MQTFLKSSSACVQSSWIKFLRKIKLYLIAIFFVPTVLIAEDNSSEPVLKTKPGPPPGFEDLANPQNYCN